MIIAVLAAKLPAPNWIVSPDWATSTALAIVAHGPLLRAHVASLPPLAVATETVACACAGGRERDQQRERGEQSQRGPAAPAAVPHRRSQQ